MCGIAGWAGRDSGDAQLPVLMAMRDRIAHRGPDDAGVWRDPVRGLALGHRRLAILDLTPENAQPMADPASGVVLAYNGEIYNFRELRRALEGRGHRFATHGDTEVVLKSLVEWGEGAFRRFAGMFAIAAWDPRRGVLWLARDALGIKPMYLWRPVDGGLVFASEVKAFYEYPGFAPRISRASLREYLEFGFLTGETSTMFAGVERLAPAEVVEVRPNGTVARRFSHFQIPPPPVAEGMGEDARVEQLAEVLERVVAEHLVADVPVGVLLSGGVDSGLIAALASRAGKTVTVSMGFSQSLHDERDAAAETAAVLTTDHHDFLIAPGEVAREVENGAWVFDDLFADWGTLTTRILYRRCRELGLKVVLVGEGADELFAGYPQFEAAKGRWSERSAFALYRRYASRRYGRGYFRFRRVLRRHAGETRGDFFEAVRRFEVRNQLPGNYVMKVDKASMSESVEARTPYLDRRIAELAFGFTRPELLAEGTNKLPLRRAAERCGWLPATIARRPKVGGSIAASWLDEIPEFRSFAQDAVSSPDGWTTRLGLRRAMQDFFAGRTGYPFPRALSLLGHLGWRLLLLELWSRHYPASEAA